MCTHVPGLKAQDWKLCAMESVLCQTAFQIDHTHVLFLPRENV